MGRVQSDQRIEPLRLYVVETRARFQRIWFPREARLGVAAAHLVSEQYKRQGCHVRIREFVLADTQPVL